MTKSKKKTTSEIKQEKEKKLMRGVAAWASFYRANPHRFVADFFNINLKWYQQIILCMMFVHTNAIYLASRGAGKSFLVAIFACVYCILYPGAQICVASKTRGQAIEIIDKVEKILRPASPMLQHEIAEIHNNQQKAEVRFKNGSYITVVTANEGARHNRATVLLLDEYRMIDKYTIDAVLKKFLTASPRMPGYLKKPEYANYPQEKTKEIYTSSCWYESHWSYELVRSYMVNMVKGRSYFCCSVPYQLAIREGQLDRDRVENEMSESTFNSVLFQMEMEALFFGQGNGGLYDFDEIDKNRVVKYPIYPKYHGVKLQDKRLHIQPKHPEEIRILSADIALISSAKNNNDATSIFLNQMLPTANGKYISNIMYTENNEGLRTDTQAIQIRKLFEDFACDYLVIDAKGLGIGVLDLLMSDLYDPNTGITYSALSCCNNSEIASRCTSPNAPKVIWAVQGSADFNSQCALGLRECFKQGTIRLLTSEYDADDAFSEIKGYGSLTPTDELTLKLPYIHTSLLVNELINLEYETKNNVIKVKEKPGMRKDRYSSLSYNIYVAKQIEKERAKRNAKKKIDNVTFNFRAPKVRKNR